MTLPPRQAVNILNIRAAKNEKPDTAIPIFFLKNELPTLININFYYKQILLRCCCYEWNQWIDTFSPFSDYACWTIAEA